MKELSLHILDIVQNSLSANSKLIEIEINENFKDNVYSITITDKGIGMNKELLVNVTDPYYTTRTTRKVGMGISLFKQNAERSGGKLTIDSELGKGTVLEAIFEHNHIDRPQLGDIAGVVVLTAISNKNIRFIYRHTTDFGKYIFDTDEIKESLGELNINQAKIMSFLKEMIIENLKEIKYSN